MADPSFIGNHDRRGVQDAAAAFHKFHMCSTDRA